MVSVRMTWSKENLWDFVRYFTLARTKFQKIFTVLYAVCGVLIFIAGITAFIVLGEPLILAVTGFMFVIMLGYGFFFYFMMRGIVKKLMNENTAINNAKLLFGDEIIYIEKDGNPFGAVPWEKISDICITKNASFLTTKDNALLIAAFRDIITDEGGIGTDEFILFLNKKKTLITNK